MGKPVFPFPVSRFSLSGTICSRHCSLFAKKLSTVKRWILAICLAIGLNGLAQNGLMVNSLENTDLPAGVISGKVQTTDGKAAAFVTVQIKENNRVAVTDDNGVFVFRNLKDGIYTLEISMVGLIPQQKTIEVYKDETSNISITLVEDLKQLTNVVITSGRRLNNQVVSIGKASIHPMDLPQSIATIGQGVIREQQAQRLSDVVRNVNGVYITTTRGNVQESFGARGYSFGSTNLFKNGSRINSGAMPEMSSLEKVEVLKGSAAILYGQVAPGGILNMVTKQPKFRQGGEVSMRIGSYSLYKPAFDIYGPISNNIAYRLNGTYENAQSFRDGVASERFYVNPSFLFKLGNNTELLLEGDHLNHEFTPDFGIGSLDSKKIPDVPRSRFMGTSWQYSKTKQSTATASLKHHFSEAWNLSTLVSYQHYNRDYFAVERIQAAANGDWTRPLGKVFTTENYYTAQLNINGKFKTAFLEHNLLAGADADHTLTKNNSFSFPAVAGLPANSYDRINILDPSKYTQRNDIPEATNTARAKIPSYRVGVYAQDLIKITPKINLLAGIRWSYLETKATRSFNLLNGSQSLTGSNRYDQAFSPRVGLVYKPFKSTSLFASYSNSFIVNSGMDVDSNALKPSIIDQYEAGIKNEFLNGLLSVNLTVYRIVNNNLAQTAPFLKDGTENNNTAIKQLTGTTTSDGIELDIAASPLKGLNISAGYSYNYMRYTQTDTTAGAFKTGERLVNNPAHTANASLFYTVINGRLKGFKAGVTAAYIGERSAGWNSDVVKQPVTGTNPLTYAGPFTYRDRIFTVDGYATIDLSAGYTYKNISVMGKVSNLTNTLNYYVHENYSINPIAPTQFVATVSYKF